MVPLMFSENHDGEGDGDCDDVDDDVDDDDCFVFFFHVSKATSKGPNIADILCEDTMAQLNAALFASSILEAFRCSCFFEMCPDFWCFQVVHFFFLRKALMVFFFPVCFLFSFEASNICSTYALEQRLFCCINQDSPHQCLNHWRISRAETHLRLSSLEEEP